jgi:hypothetical protein
MGNTPITGPKHTKVITIKESELHLLTKKLRKEIIDALVDDMADTVAQWTLNDWDSLWEWLNSILNYDSLGNEDIIQAAESAGLLEVEEEE